MNRNTEPSAIEHWYLQSSEKKAQIVENIIDEIVLETCQRFGVTILTNPMNPKAYHHLYDGATTKSADINLNTDTSSLLGGFIISDDPRLSKPASFNCDNGIEYQFVSQPSQQAIRIIPNQGPQPCGKLIYILTDQEGRTVTSDLDILMILAPESFDRTILPESLCFGSILKYEYDIITTLNQLFEQALRSVTGHQHDCYGPLVQHGPFNRFYKTTKEFIHFPLKVYDQNMTLRIIEPDSDSMPTLTKVIQQCSEQGLMIELPAPWRCLWVQ